MVLHTPWAPTLVATYHPSAVLRSDTETHASEVFDALVADLQLARGAADEG